MYHSISTLLWTLASQNFCSGLDCLELILTYLRIEAAVGNPKGVLVTSQHAPKREPSHIIENKMLKVRLDHIKSIIAKTVHSRRHLS